MRSLCRGCRDCNLTLEKQRIVVVSISGRARPTWPACCSVYAPDTDGVLALAGELCQSADAHLVARESPGGEFETVLFSAAGRPQIWPAGGPAGHGWGVSVGAPLQSLASLYSTVHSTGGSGSNKGCLAAIRGRRSCVICSRQDMWSLAAALNEAEDFVLPLDWLFLHDRREPMRVPVSGLYGPPAWGVNGVLLQHCKC
uniref:Flavin_Reduct domain-containing protein n=1 Tax=Macrostomum lignano TaxID=282301 RepID=A0A1I8FCE2_9PLAT